MPKEETPGIPSRLIFCVPIIAPTPQMPVKGDNIELKFFDKSKENGKFHSLEAELAKRQGLRHMKISQAIKNIAGIIAAEIAKPKPEEGWKELLADLQHKLSLAPKSALQGFEITDIYGDDCNVTRWVHYTYNGLNNFLQPSVQSNFKLLYAVSTDLYCDRLSSLFGRLESQQIKRQKGMLQVDPYLLSILEEAGQSPQKLAARLGGDGQSPSINAVKVETMIGKHKVTVLADNGRLTVGRRIDDQVNWSHNALSVKGIHFPHVLLEQMHGKLLGEVVEHPGLHELLASRVVKSVAHKAGTTTLYT